MGLLIAVGIEGCVELHREHKLVREARETMRAEIQHNADEMKDAVVSVEKQQAAMQKNIDVLTRILENPTDKKAQNASIDADFGTGGCMTRLGRRHRQRALSRLCRMRRRNGTPMFMGRKTIF